MPRVVEASMEVRGVSLSPRPAAGYPITRKGIRRTLFGPVDHEQTHNELQRISKILDERDRSAYNFDFKKGTPCSGGRFEWEKVDSENTESVPRAYELPHLENKSSSVHFVPLGVRGAPGSSLPGSQRCDSPLTAATSTRPLGELDTNTDRCPSPFTVYRPSTPTDLSTSSSSTTTATTSSQSSPSPSPSSSSRQKRKQTQIPAFFPCKKRSKVQQKPSS